MLIPDSISNYLRTFTQELGERILESFPPLHAVDDPPSPMIGKLLRKPYPAQTLAIMGLVRRWQQARAGAVRPVVHVERALPGDAPRVDAELVAPIDVVVDQRRQQVVRGADRVEVAGEMQVDVLHRHHLGVTAAGSAAFHAERGVERRLAQAQPVGIRTVFS